MAEAVSGVTTTARQQQRTPEFLCSDLDGTILATDSAWESLLALISRRPWFVFLLPFWLARGKAAVKAKLARYARLDVSTLPLRENVVDFLKEEAANGRKLILATGADQLIAGAVAERLGFFEAVLASDGITNLTRQRKREAIEQYVGGKDFDYVGDSAADLPVWSAACSAILVRPPARLLRQVESRGPVASVLGRRNSRWTTWLRALRLHHWVKNLLVFLPVVMAHQIRSPALMISALLAFVAFSLCASGAYVVNDLLDLEADRLHSSKRNRPFASGELSLGAGMAIAPILILAGLLVGASLGNHGLWFDLGSYVAATIVYSVYVKRVPVADVLVLMGLYLLRIFAGGTATGVPLSPWLIGFSMFFLMSLAFAKRHAEIRTQLMENGTHGRDSKRNYAAEDLDMVRQFGVTSGYISVLVLALYINGREVEKLYRHPAWIWLACPLLLFWISRVWFLANRGRLHEDPIVFAAEDKVSYLAGLVLVLILFLAS